MTDADIIDVYSADLISKSKILNFLFDEEKDER